MDQKNLESLLQQVIDALYAVKNAVEDASHAECEVLEEIRSELRKLNNK